MRDFQSDPLKALGKGWGLFSSAVAVAGSTINESVIRPGISAANEGLSQLEKDERARGLMQEAKGTVGWLGSVAGQGWQRAQELAKERGAGGGGIDLDESLAHLRVNEGEGGRGKYAGFGNDNGGSSWAPEGHTDDQGWSNAGWDDEPKKAAPTTKAQEVPKKKDGEWDDEWKDF